MTSEEFSKRIREIHKQYEQCVKENDPDKALKLVHEAQRLDHEVYDLSKSDSD